VGETSSSSLPEVTEEEVSNDSQRFLVFLSFWKIWYF